MRLVTVIIVAYNSEPFIHETLESVLNQTWGDIELIITDDCSVDATVSICNKWLKDNKHRFVSTRMITSDVNTGVTGNANRGLFYANGEWVKFLGADDSLKTNCLELNMNWISCHPEIKVLFSKVEIYRDSLQPDNLVVITEDDSSDPKSIMSPDRSAQSQYKMLLISDRIHYTPSAFINRETLLLLGGFDENYKYLEDYPLWLKLTKIDMKLFFMNEITVKYRQHSRALNNLSVKRLIKPNYFHSENLRRAYTYPFLPIDIMLCQRFNWYALQIFRFDFINHDNLFNRFLFSLVTIYLNPFKYLIWLKIHLNKKLISSEFYS